MTEISRTRNFQASMDHPLFLSTSSGSLFEELRCPVCLDVFTDPVSTPCGHNFCKNCLNNCWDNSQNCSCPLCKASFSKRPNLKINTGLREVTQVFINRLSLRISEVVCDICDEKKMKAVKSCLVCQTSYCETHLEPHLRVPSFKKHKLMEPVKNIKNYICQKHERPLELFCTDDKMYICGFCTDGDHKTHNTVPIQEEIKEKKIQMVKAQEDMQQMIQDRINKIQDIKHSAELRKEGTEREKASSVEFFKDMILSIERCQAELLEMMEEKEKVAEKQDGNIIQELQQEITELKIRSSDLDHFSQTEDHLQLLQIYPAICRPPPSREWPEISMNTNTDLGVETLRKALTQLQTTLDVKISQAVLRKMQQYAVDVTLDRNTAHPELVLSDDGKQVIHGDKRNDLPDIPERFNHCPSVLGREGFSSGRFYFEVQVKGRTEWVLGVARESIDRKGLISLCSRDGHWCLALKKGDQYWATADPAVSLSPKIKPEKVGVFVDYEEGLVSFYDVESRSHIYSFTGQSFINRLYLYFCACLSSAYKQSAPMIISAVNYGEKTYTNV